MKPTKLLIPLTLLMSDPALAQPGWRMHEWGEWGWSGMFLGPVFMILWLAVLAAVITFVVRWVSGSSFGSTGRRSPREMLDERYARGEIDREEYLRRRDDIAGKA